ncbi:phosphoserine phosphatase SerB [Temperatibacter marinus]|uniref:Phosphoserine phosphatase n=1 Tax=Temperatibacter marinus TaxID=1456591 RepID=A0AA52H9V2_9PROT|nr:phosphoserine phosphatase SerB [Temperatibacter marinus]WND02075.1 phosphoserine phosphatase SerB [Temperatibacter marinus]
MAYTHVLTIIRPNDHTEDLESFTESFSSHMKRMMVDDFTLTLLSENTAFDLKFTEKELEENHTITSTLQGICENTPGFDWFIQPLEHRKKKMLIADMDSTMITIECIDELADYAGIKDKVSEITERAMQGELDFHAALIERVALLKDMKASVLMACYEEKVAFTAGAYESVQTMLKKGAVTALVSGGFTYFTEKVSSHLGFQHHKANILEIKEDRLTGAILPPISDSQTKIDTLHELAERFNINPSDIMAVGDGANDIPMIKGAGVGVAYKAKEKARSAADFQINYTDLKSILYIQGYTEDQILTP